MNMPLPLVLILLLLSQQLALPAALSAAQTEDCVASSCCQVVETTSCCGIVSREMQCSKTGGHCLCGIQSDDDEPAPEAPRPTDRSELTPVFVDSGRGIDDLPSRVKPQAPPVLAMFSGSHNNTQALLGIWRT